MLLGNTFLFYCMATHFVFIMWQQFKSKRFLSLGGSITENVIQFASAQKKHGIKKQKAVQNKSNVLTAQSTVCFTYCFFRHVIGHTLLDLQLCVIFRKPSIQSCKEIKCATLIIVVQMISNYSTIGQHINTTSF